MPQQYRKRGQIDVYEPVPSTGNSWIGWAIIITVLLVLLSKCSH